MQYILYQTSLKSTLSEQAGELYTTNKENILDQPSWTPKSYYRN